MGLFGSCRPLLLIWVLSTPSCEGLFRLVSSWGPVVAWVELLFRLLMLIGLLPGRWGFPALVGAEWLIRLVLGWVLLLLERWTRGAAVPFEFSGRAPSRLFGGGFAPF